MKKTDEKILAKHAAGYWKTGCLESILVTDTLLKKVFFIENDTVVEKRLCEFENAIELTTRPHGYGAKHFVEFHESGAHAGKFVCVEVVGWGGHKHVFDRFDTAFDAVAHIEKVWEASILESDTVDLFYTKTAAENELADLAENEQEAA